MSTIRPFQVAIVTMGTLLEWAEYTFYAYMAVTLSALFFPASGGAGLNLLYTFGIFSAGFLMRPLGAALFGHIGDYYGRRPALLLSMLCMGIATAGIGCLPTYESIGFWAPALLVIFRLLQGLSVGGEYHGAGIYLVEQATRRPHLAGSWISFGAGLGTIIGAAAAYWVSLPGQPIWAWRVPFIIGALFSGFCFMLRRYLPEAFHFKPASEQSLSLMALVRQCPRPFIAVMSISALAGSALYIGNIYFQSYLIMMPTVSTHQANTYVLIAQVLVTLFIPMMAFLADCTNGRRLFLLGALATGLTIPLQFWLAASSKPMLIWLAVLLYALSYGLLCGPMFKTLTDLFEPEYRYRAVGLAWNISAVLFSGTTLTIAQAISLYSRTPELSSIYVTIFSIFTLCAMLRGITRT